MSKIKLGDVVEISTPGGFAYAQYVNTHPKYGALLRVLSGVYPKRLTDVGTLVRRGDVQFLAFFPLQAAINKGILTRIANAPIPVAASEFPTFRTGIADPATGKVAVWWLWDGKREWKVGTLSEAQRQLPIRGIWNDTLLVERIVSGWRPETDSTT